MDQTSHRRVGRAGEALHQRSRSAQPRRQRPETWKGSRQSGPLVRTRRGWIFFQSASLLTIGACRSITFGKGRELLSTDSATAPSCQSQKHMSGKSATRRSGLNPTLYLDYARTRNCAWRCGVRTRACRVETHLDAWVSRTEICETRGTGVEMSLVSTRHARVRTPRRCLFT